MPTIYTIADWQSLQQYKDRKPKWIKFHRDILDNRKYMSMSMASRAILPMLFLLASEGEEGKFDGSVEELTFRLRISETDARNAIKELIDNEFVINDNESVQNRTEAYENVPRVEESRGDKRQRKSRERVEKDKRRTIATSVAECGKKCTGEYSDDFNKFWGAYPVRKAKGAAWKAWQKLKPDGDLTDAIVSHLKLRVGNDRAWNRDGGKYIPHPATWLNASGFEDEWEQDLGLSDKGHQAVRVAQKWLSDEGVH